MCFLQLHGSFIIETFYKQKIWLLQYLIVCSSFVLMFSNIFYLYLESRIPRLWILSSVSSSSSVYFIVWCKKKEGEKIVLTFLFHLCMNFISLSLFPSHYHFQGVSSLLWFFSRSTAFPKLSLWCHTFSGSWSIPRSMNTANYQFPVCVQYVYIYYFTFSFWEWLCVFPLTPLLPSVLCHAVFPASPLQAFCTHTLRMWWLIFTVVFFFFCCLLFKDYLKLWCFCLLARLTIFVVLVDFIIVSVA